MNVPTQKLARMKTSVDQPLVLKVRSGMMRHAPAALYRGQKVQTDLSGFVDVQKGAAESVIKWVLPVTGGVGTLLFCAVGGYLAGRATKAKWKTMGYTMAFGPLGLAYAFSKYTNGGAK